MTLTEQQARAAHAAGSVAVVAGAGSGKTHMLTARFLHHLDHHHFTPLQIVAVTFTEKAAAELRARIRRAVQHARPHDFDALAELEAAQISTIHGLCARIVRDHPEAADVSPGARVLDEQQTKLWLAEHFHDAVTTLPETLLERLPFSRHAEILAKLLEDPISAERALQVGAAGWEEWARQARQDAARELVNQPEWREGLRTLESLGGLHDDRIELARQAASRHAQALTRGEAPEEHGPALLSVKLTGGSAKNWPNGGLSETKDAIKTLRALTSTADSRGLTLTSGESDAWLQHVLPDVRAAFEHVRSVLTRQKRRAGLLDFADLEVHALRALQNPEVQAHYARRWRAYLLDEFQDTNAVQHEILRLLRADAITTVVGDEKQSIYGFRRADARLFHEARHEIRANGGEEVPLDLSFRTHRQLVDQCNTVFAQLLGDLHAPLQATREPTQPQDSAIEAYLIDAGNGEYSSAPLKRAEGALLARRLQQLLEQQHLIHGPDGPRPVQPGDIAVLTRTWSPLSTYGAALAAHGVPVIEAGSGSLLHTREALDAINLLSAIALHDEAAIVGTLRSPFCALSDRTLHQLHLERGERGWLDVLEHAHDPAARRAHELFTLLEARRRHDPPSRLLQLADRFTGYTAVLANLWGAPRRLADWRGTLDLIRALESGEQDAFHVTRRLRELINADLHVPRPTLEAGNAVTLLTMHGAKGLEWPVVAVADLGWTPPGGATPVLFDPQFGVALKPDVDGAPAPVPFALQSTARARLEEAETRRLLYVALTRARDHLILTAAGRSERSLLARLEPGLAAAGIRVTRSEPLPGDTDLPPLADLPHPAGHEIEWLGPP